MIAYEKSQYRYRDTLGIVLTYLDKLPSSEIALGFFKKFGCGWGFVSWI